MVINKNSDIVLDGVYKLITSPKKPLAREYLMKILGVTSFNGMRGVAVFVGATAPTDPQVNDIWIQI